MFVNKIILTANRFPSPIFLAASQMCITFVLLLTFSLCGLAKILKPSQTLILRIIPFSCIYAIDVVMGLAGTGAISLPLFSALRRISNFFILFGERYFFGKRHSVLTHIALITMVTGAFVAVSGDINFDPIGYGFIFINNISTAAKGLLTKSRLSNGTIRPVVEFPLWTDAFFVAGFIFSCLAAVTLQFLTFECTRLTSALTTSVIGVLKNTIVSYGGMFVGGDYIFTVVNFCGVTISTTGAITYGVSMYLSKRVKLAISTSGKA
ncbi:UDP-glucuronic acid/UDP-N-acetylgalactosamine transporter [Taenia crassiceps]|uniref:UDP-glucuronic acid/UDP-N-acetylgalactosamine transporter n=1 Tax=Taenia crassiceps TaxID=6207 RepID=A0ABR4QCT5_9CEST